jgi:nitroreductase
MEISVDSPKMSLEETILARRSVRGFLDIPVPREIIDEAMELAQRSPSNSNIQPWKVFIASGKTRDKIRDEILTSVTRGDFGASDFSYPGRFSHQYRKRQVECAKLLYGEMGIARDDKRGRISAVLRNFEFFDAPHVAFLCMEKDFPATIAADVGIYAQTLMLAFTSLGVGTCPMGALRNHPDIVRETFGYGDNLGVLFGMAFGYEDPSIAANRVSMGRAPVEESVVFMD